MKRIQIITETFYPVTAGTETNIIETYSNLASKGLDVTVHTSKNTLTEFNVLPDNGEIRGIKIKRYFYHKYGFIPQIDWKFTDIVAIHNFNIFPHILLLFYILYLKILTKKKFAFIFVPHGGMTPEWSSFEKRQRIISKIVFNTIAVLLINLTADGIRSVSNWEKKQLVKIGVNKNKIYTIVNGIQEFAFFREKDIDVNYKKYVKSLGNYIIQVGRINKEKNFEVAIKALQYLPKTLSLIIVGPDHDIAYKKQLIELIKSMGLEDRVTFTGVVRYEKKYYLIRNAKAMVHMAKWESFCNVVHEGMSQGLVCIVSNVTALPYLVKNGINGFTLDPEDSKGVADKINYILNHHNDAKLKAMRETNKKSTRQNTWANVALKVESFYLEILNQKNYEKK